VDRSENRFLDLLKFRRGHPVIIAHRGDSYHAPENTIQAAESAVEAGAQAWELDVQLTRDGVPVVLHDETLVRTTDVAVRFAGDARAACGYRVCDFDFAEVRSLDAGSWFVCESSQPRSARSFGTLGRLEPSRIGLYHSGSVKIPSLAEALEFTRAHDWLVNVEIKSFPRADGRLVSRVLETIAGSGIASQVLISSFDHRDVWIAGGRDRAYAVGILTATPLWRTAEYCKSLVGAETVHVSTGAIGARSCLYSDRPEARSLRVELVEELRARGIPLLVYAVNEHGPGSLARHLAELGVGGIFTDDPRAMTRDIGFANFAS
jgi:glycerophosphoryl diester phosphodiesterase